MADSTTTPEQLADYLKRKGKFGSQTLSVLGRHHPFIEAIGSEIGKQLLKDAIGLHERLLSKVATLEATDAEKMEYKAVGSILLKWSERIATYEKALAEITAKP